MGLSRWTAAGAIGVLVAGVGMQGATARQATPAASPEASFAAGAVAVRVLGVETFASDFEALGTLVGGLSGIDYDPESGRWIALSDDRSENDPARFYELDIRYDEDGFETVEFASVVTLL